jgi:hypothetical protein
METKTNIITSHESAETLMEQQRQQQLLQQQKTPTSNTNPTKNKKSHGSHSNNLEFTLTYNGQTIISAASQGNLPVCVLLWGMASAKKINIMTPDIHGNNPMHYACLAQTSEVMGFFHQQLRGMLTPEIRLVDSINHAGETPLLRAMATGQMAVIKALLDEKSSPLVSDNHGNNVLINAAKNCQLWCLNFMYDYVRYLPHLSLSLSPPLLLHYSSHFLSFSFSQSPSLFPSLCLSVCLSVCLSIGILMVQRRCTISFMLVITTDGVPWNGVLRLGISTLWSI